MRRRTLLLAWVLTWLSAASLLPSAVTAHSESDQLIADLEGRPIAPVDVGRYFCHDFDYPSIHCFSSSAELEFALNGGGEVARLVDPHGSGDYVTIYSERSYAGAYAHLSQNYDGLWAIGWNDRIRSFKVRNGASGSFHTDWYAGGSFYGFCCDSEIPVLGAAYDRTFSSVYRS